MRYGMAIDLKGCAGCHTCSTACKLANNLPEKVWWNTVLTVGGEAPDTASGVYPNNELSFMPFGCQHCDKPACVEVCPVGATYKREEDGIVVQDVEKCIGCRACAKICAHGAPQFGADGKASIDMDKCVGCGRCLAVCPKDAIDCLYDEAPTILNKKIAEYTKAVVDGRPCFHVSLVLDISPNCDCHGENDVPIAADVGMFASFDPVALDQACADAVLAQPAAPNSALFDGGGVCDKDHFKAAHPDTDWQSCLEHAEKLGLGSREYELVKI